ncbi:MFS transporter [Mycetocola reblochoni]|uniref:Membrane transport protein n=2 Tax=Mycetocola reblochoni TaxID=331618 RepID=A0A1R4ITY5_9MICO|nr:MFS transporter [Mycetocola reblochoni]RLP71051.1 MFS transporter [Mycetocola reblochoni]SJN23174.1 Membrane transport protein [Mycetocola reblochoni REB411]
MSTRTTPLDRTATLPVASVIGFLVFTELASGFVQGYYLPLIALFGTEFGVNAAQLNWFTTVFTLASAVLVPVLSKIGDRYGHRRVLRIAVVLVFAASLMVAFAPTFEVLLIGRVLMAPLTVWLPLEIALIHNRITGDTARKAIAYLVAVLAIGAVLGSLASGGVTALTDDIHLVLLVPCVMVAVALYAVFVKIPESTVRSTAKIDYAGFAGLAVIVAALLWGMGQVSSQGFTSPAAYVPIAAALIAAVLWSVWQLRVATPAIDLRLVASRALGPLYLASFLFGLVLFGNQVPFATFLTADPAVTGYGFGLTAVQLSGLTAATTGMAAVGSTVSPFLAKRLGLLGVLMLGSGIGAIAFVLQVLMHSALVWSATFFLVSWFAMGLLIGAMPTLIAERSPSDATGIAAGIYNTLRTLGGAIAGALVAFVLTVTVPDGGSVPGISGYVLVWVASAVAFGIAIVLLSASRQRVAAERK